MSGSFFASPVFMIMMKINVSLIHQGDTGMNGNTKDHRRPKTPNRLIREKSPYLLQHAFNPVEWHAWEDAAFEEARRQDKPLFVSIGYSTCHWCHVMEKESFEDPAVARLMNEAFVCVKVDREERPDLDHVYMSLCQMMTGRGGWPLTIIMTPEKKPFYAATYIPKIGRWGLTGMMELIPMIQFAWQTRRQALLSSSEKVIDALRRGEPDRPGGELDPAVLDQARAELARRYDADYGGFSDAPKFPMPHTLFFLLRHWRRSENPETLQMIENTLQKIRLGGVYDHIGFGIHRYSTDRHWLVPHFEKMLYDQALFALANLEAFQATGKTFYAETAREVFAYVRRELTAPEGGFYSAQDADSEGVEGKFYVWTAEQIREILDQNEADFALRLFNIQEYGNFQEEATGRKTGANIPYLKKPKEDLAGEFNTTLAVLDERMQAARKRLFEARETRVRPYKDDKILTDWNGLMIAAFARGAQVLGDDELGRTAERAACFILERLRSRDGRLLHRYREGESKISAHLDDYAFFIWGLLELYEAAFDPDFLEIALSLNDVLLKFFWDDAAGGFFFTSSDGEQLIIRKKEIYDGALPSGNAVAMHNLLRLARFCARADLEEKASKIVSAFSEQIQKVPSGYTHFLTALDFGFGPAFEVVITGPSGRRDIVDMLAALRRSFIPNRVTLFRPADQKFPGIDRVSGFTGKHDMIDGKATAYVCVGHFCKLPTTDVGEMLDLLKPGGQDPR